MIYSALATGTAFFSANGFSGGQGGSDMGNRLVDILDVKMA